MFPILLACGGGEIILLAPLLLLVAAMPWVAVKMIGYYGMGRLLIAANPDLKQSARRLMARRVVGGAAGFIAVAAAGIVFRSWVAVAMMLVTERLIVWSWFGHRVRPRVAVRAQDQMVWTLVGTAASFGLDMVAASVYLGLGRLLAAFRG
jgi:hypothetical protein